MITALISIVLLVMGLMSANTELLIASGLFAVASSLWSVACAISSASKK